MVKDHLPLLSDVRDLDSIPKLGRSPWRREWPPTPAFLPGNPMDREAWSVRFHRVTKIQTQLNTHARG